MTSQHGTIWIIGANLQQLKRFVKFPNSL
jgi:hypothetical protein